MDRFLQCYLLISLVILICSLCIFVPRTVFLTKFNISERMKKEDIIRRFQSKWLPKAGDYIGNALKVGQLLSLAHDKLHIKALSDVKDRLIQLMAYIRDIAMGRYKGYSVSKLSLAIAGIVYLVSPLDLIPDALLFWGWSDDIPILSFVFSQLADELHRYQQAQTDNQREVGEYPQDKQSTPIGTEALPTPRADS